MSRETTLTTESPTAEPATGAASPAAPEAPVTVEPAASSPPGAPPQAPTAPSPDPALSAAEIEALQARAAKAEENRDRYLRLAADFENYKKRAARERQEGVRLANEALLGKLVNVLDNFEVALASEANAVAPAGDSFRAGVAMIQGQLRNVLAEAGLEEIDAAGRPFDPNQHEAVAQSESTEVPEGQVLRQMRKGYRFRERLLRPASVVVARAPAAAAGPETSTPSTDH